VVRPTTPVLAPAGPANVRGSHLGGPAGQALLRVFSSSPELLAVAMAGFALPPMVMLLAGELVLPIAIPLGLLSAAVAVGVCRTSPEPASRRTAVWTAAAAAIALAWFVVNAFFSAEDLYAHRDPTTYNLTGRWLMDHPSLPIPTHPELFGSPQGYIDGSAGFSNAGVGEVYAQGNHLLPVLLAAAGHLFGVTALFKVNVLFAAMALFVFFGLARRVVGPAWALVAMSALAVSLPMIYVGRDTFSEPLALLYLMGGLLLLHRAISYGRVRDFALAGLVAGVAAMARIDSDASLLALIGVLTVLLARAPIGARTPVLIRAGAMLGSAVGAAALGWADVAWLASGYYHDERTHILLLVKAAVALSVLGACVVLLAWRPRIRAALGSSQWRRPAARLAGAAVVLAFAMLASRPLWMRGHGVLTPYLIQVQKQAGDAVDGTRTYDEQTINWQALYFGWPTVLLAVVGYVLLLHRLLRQRDYALLGVHGMGLAVSMLYLWSAQITPDQVWASRRFVPVVMPVLLVAAAFALRELHARLNRLGRSGHFARPVTAVGVAMMIGVPLVVTVPAFGVREEVPQRAQVAAICSYVGASGAVLEVDQSAQWGYGQTIRSYCNVPSLGLLSPTSAQLATVRASLLASGRTLYVLSEDPSQIPFVRSALHPEPFSSVATSRWPSTLHTTPVGSATERVTVYLGVVLPSGRVEPLSQQQVFTPR
jgi:hypothetical protein